MRPLSKPRNRERSRGTLFLLLLSCLPACLSDSAFAAPVVVGSKKFTESYVLGEIAKRALANAGLSVESRAGLGGTIIVWQALKSGAITCYADYTGTISEEILKQPDARSVAGIRAALAASGVGMTDELGFNNTYALVMRRDVAQREHIRRISDLRAHPELRFGLTHEFLDRKDGWQPLVQRYGLTTNKISGIDHGLGYDALRNGQLDVKDAYSTDAKIADYDLVTLADDLQFFPDYKAVFLYRLDAPQSAVVALRKLEHTIDDERMRKLNADAEQTKDYAHAASLYFGDVAAPLGESFPHKLARWTARHLELAGGGLLLATLVGLPLGILASRGGWSGHLIIGFASTVQTIPSLALLALFIPLPFFGISARTAIAALFLYSLLPIVRNTATGLTSISSSVRESATALGLSARTQLLKVYLPIASPTILAGVKTSAVINVGTATLAALIGAGGLGEPILSGLNLNDHRTILEGAVPAAVLALLVQWLFDAFDRVLIPRGLRLRS